jgi:hypothetical protein
MMADYEYLQQRLKLRVDLMEKRLIGLSEIILAPKSSDLKRVRLHCRQAKITRVTVNGINARFEHMDFLSEIVHESYRDWPAFDLFYRGAIVASKEGALVIELPQEIEHATATAKSNIEPNSHKSHASLSSVQDKRHIIDSGSGSPDDHHDDEDDDEKMTSNNAWEMEDVIPSSTTEYQTLHVRVEYMIENPRGGVRFLLPDRDHPNRSPHMYTYCGPFGGLCDGARTWMPCRDSLKDTCTFRIELIVPSFCVAICSGELVDQTLDMGENDNHDPYDHQGHTRGNKYRAFRYIVRARTNCSSIGFAVGPFRLYIPERTPRVSHFCLPECYHDLIHTTETSFTSTTNAANHGHNDHHHKSMATAAAAAAALTTSDHTHVNVNSAPPDKRKTLHHPHTILHSGSSTAQPCYPTSSILDFYEAYLHARYPFETYQQIFVEDPPEECQYFAGAAILDQRILYGPTIIDRKLPSHLLQVKAFVGSWIAGAIGIQSTKDAWVLIGIVGHLVNAYVRVACGDEEYGYRIQLAMDALIMMELISEDDDDDNDDDHHYHYPSQHSLHGQTRASPSRSSPSLLLINPEVDVYGEYEPSYVSFVEAKAPLIFHMIEQKVEQKLGPKHLHIALQRIVAGCSSIYHASTSHASTTTSTTTAATTTRYGKSQNECDHDDDDDHSRRDKESENENDGSGHDDEGRHHVHQTRKKNQHDGAAVTSTSGVKAGQPIALSTWPLLSIVRSIAGPSGQDLRDSFLRTWIVQGGLPFFRVGFWYNRKQTQAELVLDQTVLPGCDKYTGDIKITIIEEQGEYSYTKRLELLRHKWEFPCHGKVRKKKRTRQKLDQSDDDYSSQISGMPSLCVCVFSRSMRRRNLLMIMMMSDIDIWSHVS